MTPSFVLRRPFLSVLNTSFSHYISNCTLNHPFTLCITFFLFLDLCLSINIGTCLKCKAHLSLFYYKILPSSTLSSPSLSLSEISALAVFPISTWTPPLLIGSALIQPVEQGLLNYHWLSIYTKYWTFNLHCFASH